ncbi:hypothetical protein Dimus_013757, partial [Dionaea muscipula]
ALGSVMPENEVGKQSIGFDPASKQQIPTIQGESYATQWLKRSVVVTWNKNRMGGALLQTISSELGSVIKVAKINNQVALITFPMTAEMTSTLAKGPECWGKWFNAMEIWSEKIHIENVREIWLRCYNIPFHDWNITTLMAIGNHWGDVQTVDLGDVNRGNLEVARVRVSTTSLAYIDQFINLRVKGKLFKCRIIEEQELDWIPSVCRNGADVNGGISVDERSPEGGRRADVAEGINDNIDQNNLEEEALKYDINKGGNDSAAWPGKGGKNGSEIESVVGNTTSRVMEEEENVQESEKGIVGIQQESNVMENTASSEKDIGEIQQEINDTENTTSTSIGPPPGFETRSRNEPTGPSPIADIDRVDMDKPNQLQDPIAVLIDKAKEQNATKFRNRKEIRNHASGVYFLRSASMGIPSSNAFQASLEHFNLQHSQSKKKKRICTIAQEEEMDRQGEDSQQENRSRGIEKSWAASSTKETERNARSPTKSVGWTEAERTWKIGKDLGLTSKDKDEEVISRFAELEEEQKAV